MTPAEAVIAAYEAGSSEATAIPAAPAFCCVCGDRLPLTGWHECWAGLKLATQEIVPETWKGNPLGWWLT